MLSILAKIGFDWQVALANLVNFLIILFILRKYAFEPIKKAILNRQKIIDLGLENAKLAETDRVMAEELKTSILKDARIKADEIVRDANRKAEDIIVKAKDQAMLEKNAIIIEGNKEIEKRGKEMDSKFREKSADMILLGLEKVLGQKMTAEVDRTYIEKQ